MKKDLPNIYGATATCEEEELGFRDSRVVCTFSSQVLGAFASDWQGISDFQRLETHGRIRIRIMSVCSLFAEIGQDDLLRLVSPRPMQSNRIGSRVHNTVGRESEAWKLVFAIFEFSKFDLEVGTER